MAQEPPVHVCETNERRMSRMLDQDLYIADLPDTVLGGVPAAGSPAIAVTEADGPIPADAEPADAPGRGELR
jgi:hypothetical protein